MKWLCKVCGAANYVVGPVADGRKCLTCTECKTKHMLDLKVDVTIRRVQTLDEYEEEEEILEQVRRFCTLEVSRDQGKTWQQMRVNTMDNNPETSCLKPGDYIRAPGSKIPVVVILHNGRLASRELTEIPEGVGAATCN